VLGLFPKGAWFAFGSFPWQSRVVGWGEFALPPFAFGVEEGGVGSSVSFTALGL
jgi:hypothetical protein